MKDYEFVPHARIDDREWLTRALAELNAVTFGHYSGVVVPSGAFMDWYTRRPGMDPALCQAVLTHGRLVSSLFVTLARMSLAGERVVCGVIDTVMTRPDHRRRGLARGLLERAVAGMRDAGADISLLYTAVADPPSVPQQLYESLGYSVYELVDRFVKPPPHARGQRRALPVGTDVEVGREFEARLQRQSGWLVLEKGLWAWRRLDRPAEYPVQVYRTPDDTLAAMCTGRLLSGGRPRSFAVVSDLAPRGSQVTSEAVRSLLSAAPREATATVLCARSERWLGEALREAELTVSGSEAAMLLALSAQASRLVTGRPSSWYVAVESVVGV